MSVMLVQPTQRHPLHDWRVRAKTASVPADAAIAGELPLVGREALLLEFEQRAPEPPRAESPSLALTGEAGIGKTRMLRAFAERGSPWSRTCAWSSVPAQAGPEGVDRRHKLPYTRVTPWATYQVTRTGSATTP